MSRFGDVFEPTSNESQIVGSTGGMRPDPMTTGSIQSQPVYTPAPVASTAPLTSTALPPPPGATASNAPFVRNDGNSSLSALPAPTNMQTAAIANTTGWTPTNGTAVTLRQGDTLQVLSRRYGVPEAAIVSANGIGPNTPLRVGQQIIIPGNNGTHVASAQPTLPSSPTLGTMTVPPSRPAITAQTTIPSTHVAGGTVYVVKPGDSLGKVANSFGLRSAEVAKANGFAPDQPIRIGQKLVIPVAGAQVASAAPTATATDALPSVPLPATNGKPPVATLPAAPQQPTQVAAVAPPQVVTPASLTTTSASTTSSAADGSFRWPVRGRVISAYGSKPGGERNDGINIEVPEGTPIKAAEGGEVIYAGNELKGFGNLILVKHPNGFVSAYAHASEILVRRGDQIMRGQTIAKVGQSGNVTRPQLHFELRQGNRPVDPLPLLSG
ncbi:peptidoglycan DD-metalloendopeptidase family protein [Oryzibacter oryziterrae]|uniref:peptidoglycan DD-metalloendopeptidase family protein n=1 Tax=Oryzibacter oryziterrae TaxID=2766474 RepID=UPI001F44E7CE|nr:peptidoglycan DD-metalloendopeptidase family protein [Oryzibacter oryziterrae]